MTLGNLSQLWWYRGVPYCAKIIRALKSRKARTLPLSEYPVFGKRVFVPILDGSLVPADE